MNKEELEAIADQATSGPWEVDAGNSVGTVNEIPTEIEGQLINLRHNITDMGLTGPDRKNAEYIATFNPTLIKAMLREIEAGRELRDNINCYNVGISLLGEHKFSPLVEAYDKAREESGT